MRARKGEKESIVAVGAAAAKFAWKQRTYVAKRRDNDGSRFLLGWSNPSTSLLDDFTDHTREGAGNFGREETDVPCE